MESHVIYCRELTAGQRVHTVAQVLGIAGKRLHVALEMAEGPDCVAMQELLFVHVDLASRRATLIPAHIAGRIRAQAAPAWAGRRIALAGLAEPGRATDIQREAAATER